MSLKNLTVFFERLEKDKSFRIKLIEESGITRKVLLDSFENQEKFITKKIIHFAEKSDMSFTFEELLEKIFESEKLKKLENDELEDIAGGISFKKFSSIMLATGILALTPITVLANSDITTTNLTINNVSSSVNIENEKTVDYNTIGEIIKAKPDLNKIDDTHPMNEVDNMIFSTISYLPILSAIPRFAEYKEHITIKEYAEKINEVLESNDDALLKKYLIAEDYHSWENYNQKLNDIFVSRLEFLQDLAKCDRYKDIKMGDYKVEYRPASSVDEYSQFAAITFTIENGEKVIVFRGTDYTQSGWKENLRTLWNRKVPAQRDAVNYVTDMMRLYPKSQFTISGHSKGGALAVYAFLKTIAAPGRISRIKKVYSFDGPGINDEVIKKDKEKDKYENIYKELGDEIKEKIMIFIPQTSFVGSLMKNDEYFNYFVVMSDTEGFYQHNPATWKVNPDFIKPDTLKFKFSEKTLASIAYEEAWAEIVKKLDKAEAKRVTKILFDFYSKNGLNADLGIKSNLKKIFFNYIEGKSTFELLKLIFSPSKIVTLSDKESEEFKHVGEIVVKELLTSYWKHHEEFNKDLQLSEKSLVTLKQLKDSGFSQKQIMSTMWTLTKEYIKKVGVFNFLKNLF